MSSQGLPPALPPRSRPAAGSFSRYHTTLVPECIPEESAVPPAVPPHKMAPVRRYSGNAGGNLESRRSNSVESTNLEDQPWFWGQVDREDVNDWLRDRPDGTFLVRNSSSPGDYTLTLRKDNSNKLIKIYSRDGKFGFSLTEQLRFSSVVELVEHYRHHSLKQYNRNLDMTLMFPLNRKQILEEEYGKHHDPEKLKRELCYLHAEYLRKSQQYDTVYEEYNAASQELQTKGHALTAFRETLKMFQEQKKLLSGYEAQASEHELKRIQDNLALIQTRCDSLREHINQLEDNLKKSGAHHKKLEREMTAIKPVLLRLYRRRERCQCLLIQKDILTQVELQELLTDVTLKTEQEKLERRVERLDRGTTVESPEYCVSNNTQAEEDEESQSDSCAEEVDRTVGRWEPDTWLISGKCDKVQAISMLQSRPDGTFLIRSSSKPGYYALSVVCKNSVHHCLIEYQKGAGYGFEGTKVVFRDLAQFVRHYSSNSLGDHNELLDTRLKYPVKKATGAPK